MSSASDLILFSDSESFSSKSSGSGNTPSNALFVNHNARLTKFPRFPINSELILIAN